MTALQFCDLLDRLKWPLWLNMGGMIRSCVCAKSWYPTVAVADSLGLTVGGYELGYNGCVALGMPDREAQILLIALNNSMREAAQLRFVPEVQTVRSRLMARAGHDVNACQTGGAA